jgi:hypothetical protein
MKWHRWPILGMVCVAALSVLLFASALPSRQGSVFAASNAQQATGSAVPACPIVKLQSLADVNADLIASHAKLGSSGLPCDSAGVVSAPSPVLSLQEGFDYFSWLTFLALNSPANGDEIGKDTRTFWETWKQLPDVMLPNGIEPTEWDHLNNAGRPDECATQFKPGMMVIRMDLEETYNEPFKSGPLFDQNGNYALFVIFMNKTMFDYIDPRDEEDAKSKGQKSLYSIALQRQFVGPVNFPSGDANGPGSVMVKASWKILTPKDDPSQYHTVPAILYLKGRTNPCQMVRLGLIGFHVGHKTKTRQQWVWTTFEHVRNVPTENEVATGKYNFFSVADKGREVNQTPPGPWDPDERKWDPDHPSTFKSQIVRTGSTPPEISAEVQTLNQAFQEFLKGSVWANYELISTQWPSDFGCSNTTPLEGLPDQTCAPFPTYLANSTLETFSQPLLKSGGVPLATSSCIACHNNATTHQIPARRSDFTYILEKAQ